MRSFSKMLVVSGIALLVGVSATHAQVTDAARTVYRLNDSSTYQHGCFPPCDCPIMEPVSTRGTFVLRPTGFDGLFREYDVADVNWTVALGDPELRITGSGTYRIGGEFALLHQLVLELTVGDEPPTRFDSGLIPGGSGFPDIAISVSINGVFCLDTVIAIDASPVPVDEIQSYRLVRGSTWQEGCFPPCRCPLFAEQPLRGSFALVELQRTWLFREYAVVNANWRVRPFEPGGDSFPIVGFGTYRVGGEFVAQHQMTLDLSVDGGALTHFDSGLLIGGGQFPSIDIVMTMNDFYCYDQVIHVVGQPAGIWGVSSAPVGGDAGMAAP